ncbi:hypothetical protein AAY473_002024 [Plecturocebus cupreus]
MPRSPQWLGYQAYATTPSYFFIFLAETGFHYVGQAGLDLLTSLECSGKSWLTGTSASPTEFHHVSQSGLELLTSRSASIPTVLLCDPSCIVETGVHWRDLSTATSASHSPVTLHLSFPDTGFCHVTLAGLQLLGTNYPPVLASQTSGITCVGHHDGDSHSVTQAGVQWCNNQAHYNLCLLGSSNSPASVSQVVGLQAHATMPD